MLKDYLQLHFVVFLWGFTAILGYLIQVPTVELVLWRTLLAAGGLAFLMSRQGLTFRIGQGVVARLLGTGVTMAAHWVLFFEGARVASVSVCLAGMATASLWTALLEPLVFRRPLRWYEVGLGLVVILGLYLIFRFQFDQALGLFMGVASAFLGALFTVINAQFTQRHHHYAITFYEMVGAFATTLLFLPVYLAYTQAGRWLPVMPSLTDWFYLALLAWVCTVYAYSASIELLRRITAFTMNLTVNLEPVYGIGLAALFFNEHDKLTSGFYAGTLVILAAVLVYPFIKKWDAKRQLAA
ncbi:MAG: DMT family transporter [Bernardetiaceae bacterium]|jgi:drug/metabolite transporter (DMT)-like permease|nr:DMT family transporter [Bernardetiaceae bacterium]